jgi:predicted enzyme related to lactoylglutathione lyase
MLDGLHTLICEVSDMDRSVEFYRDVLGFKLTFEDPHWSSLQIGTTSVGLHPPFSRSEAVKGGGWIFGLSTADIRAFRARLEAAGVVCGDYHGTPGGVIFDFADPDGNRLQVIQPGLSESEVRA